MLPYWYKQMITYREGKHFFRSEAGQDLVFKHKDLFVIGMFESGYHPILNIRCRRYFLSLLYFFFLILPVKHNAVENRQPLSLYLAPTLSWYHQISICSSPICGVRLTNVPQVYISISFFPVLLPAGLTPVYNCFSSPWQPPCSPDNTEDGQVTSCQSPEKLSLVCYKST